MNSQLFASFSQVQIINLIDRPDRREEMTSQLRRLGAMGQNVSFFEAHRPNNPGDFPSLGARGCFESHLAILRRAQEAGLERLLILEDDFDFTRGGRSRAPALLQELIGIDWDFFYGAHVIPAQGRSGLAAVASEEPVLTTSFVAFSGRVIPGLVEFLEAMLHRPAGSPEFGPMHVDGAYTVFRRLHPNWLTFAAFPSLGRQRSSQSDVTPSGHFLDRWPGTKRLGRLVRSGYNFLARS